jgi:hypothetical protein
MVNPAMEDYNVIHESLAQEAKLEKEAIARHEEGFEYLLKALAVYRSPNYNLPLGYYFENALAVKLLELILDEMCPCETWEEKLERIKKFRADLQAENNSLKELNAKLSARNDALINQIDRLDATIDSLT